jgi:hypothetical protein
MTRALQWISLVLVCNVTASVCILGRSAPTNDPRRLFELEHQAVGGASWNGIAAIRTTGDFIVSGAPGPFVQLINHRNGHSHMIADAGPLHDISGFDGVSWDAQGGIVNLIDLPSLQEDAVTQAYVARDGWWDPADSALMKLNATQQIDGRQQDVIEITPRGGSPIDVYLDGTTHLITRTLAHTDGGIVTTVYSDWHEVNGLKLSYHQVQTDPTGGITTTETKTAETFTTVTPDMFARPAAEALGKITSGSSASIPFRTDKETSGHMIVEAVFDGKLAKVYFDTGGANYLVPSAAQGLGLTSAGGVNVGGVGTTSESGGFAKIKTVALGAAQLRNQTAIVAPLPFVARHPAALLNIDGLVGYEFLSQFRTTVDYIARTITFSPFSNSASATGVKLPIFSDGHSVFVKGAIDGENGLFRIDTGDADGVSIFGQFADDHKLFQSDGLEYVHAGGVGGSLPYRLYRGHVFTIGGIDLRSPLVERSETKVGGFASRSIAGNIGADILGRFRLIFDYQAGTLTLVPNTTIDQPFPADRTGLSLTQTAPEEFTVLAVLGASPADVAGIRANDKIAAVNGRSVADQHLGLYDIRPQMMTDDSLSLRLRRGDALKEVVVHPRKLI